jgi:RNA polymerase sigma-70 factor (ECF subfamily)
MLAAGEVALDPRAGPRTEVAVEVVGQAVARLATTRDPGFHEEAQHIHAGHLDAERRRFVSGSYDLRVAPGEETDAELVRQAQEGSLDAFAEIVRRHERRLRMVLLRVLDDTRDVDEAVQDAFVQAWRNLDRYRGEAALFTWLYRIGVNAALAQARRKRLPTSGLDSLLDEGAPQVARDVLPEPAAEAQDARTRVVAALAKLPFENREAVVLHDLAGLSNEEVATALDVSLAAAKSRIHRGRLQLRDLLESREGR